MVYLYNVILLAGESNMDGCKNNFAEGKKPEKKAYVSYNYNIKFKGSSSILPQTLWWFLRVVCLISLVTVSLAI